MPSKYIISEPPRNSPAEKGVPEERQTPPRRRFVRERIRSPVASGFFYPDEPEEIKAFFASCGLDGPPRRGEKAENALGIIVPHSAWNRSGKAAADAFALCRERRDSISRVVLLGAIHDPLRTGLFLSNSDFFETPLGELPVDGKSCEELASCSTVFEINDIPHLREFSIEVLLPFVKYCFPGVSIVPVLMGVYSPRLIKGLAGALNVVFGENRGETLFVISSCLSKNKNSETAFAQADRFVTLINEGNGGAIGNEFPGGALSACGAPLAAACLECGLLVKKQNTLLSDIRQIPGEDGYVCYGSMVLE
ncbi:MAG: AmmeMemoRadiSam system protein B [Treponema sp.]|jgi:AmmeMemoRadiSam system protein B|nr:AmmeMemoRadiSam system protein B [Treponema sp.]